MIGEASESSKHNPLLSAGAAIANGGSTSAEIRAANESWERSRIWRILHALGFLLGGVTFLIGTILLYPVQDYALSLWSAILYTIGSVGFLVVDLLEFVTFTTPWRLRFNIFLSATGSSLYILGSIGFLPSILDTTAAIGLWGFVLGSSFIGCSQFWKLLRIGWVSSRSAFSFRHMMSSMDRITSVGVEGGAFFGAWLFFVGTVLDFVAPDTFGVVILNTWVGGSVAFTTGGIFLALRHFYLDL